MKKHYPIILILLVTHSLFGQSSFTEVSKEAGINHAFVVDQATFGGGACVIDFDNDGWEDVYITGGLIKDALYKNNGDGSFTNVIDKMGFENVFETNTQGVTAADVNRDGFKDLLVTTMNFLSTERNSAPNFLFINNGDGTFSDQTKEWGLDQYTSNSTGASFGDINKDGYPDLYVSNYYSSSPIGINIYNESTITNSFVPAYDFLFLNTGGESFIEVSEAYGVNHQGFGFQGVFSDFDNDRDLDLHVVNDFGFKKTPNRMYRNEYPRKKLLERSNSLRLNYGMNAMGIAFADVNLDGWMDYFVTNLSTSVLVYNKRNGEGFEDMTVQANVAIPTITDEEYSGPPISWGANFFDFDHDMDEDLFVCNGALNPTIRLNPNLFFRNDGGRFQEVAKEYGLFDFRIGRGSVVFDYDKDGDLDLLVVNQAPRQPTTLNGKLLEARCLLLRNDAADGNWLQVELEGMHTDKNGLGARIEVVVDDLVLIREIDGGSSHLSQNTTIAHFGLGDHEEVSSVTVHWIGGALQQLSNVDANQRIKITEDTETGIDPEMEVSFNVTPTAFRSQVTITYELPESQSATVNLYSADGRLIETLVNQAQGKIGVFQTTISPDLPMGVYYFRLISESGNVTIQAVKG
ncbi:FG-GAP-like repeat-containing protein [Portibacter marinus]|uniref:FG-GAP-like repeat-containing protein n=1 Tax=Portibacter marinus TaxID=2898660 RepID=UPI001F257569|nr:FG-GAP-like repeat-containing protein [Portibacter marinus]